MPHMHIFQFVSISAVSSVAQDFHKAWFTLQLLIFWQPQQKLSVPVCYYDGINILVHPYEIAYIVSL